MKKKVNHDAMAAAGYTAPWHAPAGSAVELHLSTAAAVRDVRVMRLDVPEPMATDWPVERLGAAPGHESIDLGSFLRVGAAQLAGAGPVEGVSFEVFLTRNHGERAIVETDSFALTLADDGLRFRLGDRLLLSGEALPARDWLRIDIASTGSGVALDITGSDLLAPFKLHREFDAAWKAPGQDLLFGASLAHDRPTLNAKFASIALRLSSGSVSWTFPTRLTATPLLSSGAAVLELEAVNLPTFCTTSSRWNGSSFDPRLEPSHYDAIHCHDDDLGPLDWPACFRAELPRDAASGVYAFEIEHERGSEQIVFFVVAAAPRNRLLFLVPTATYLAYADEFLPEHLYEWKCPDRGQQFAIDNNLRSLYDYHSDASGVSICSYRKPKATLRPDYNYPLCGGPHNLPVDLHFLRFCHASGIAFDLTTDHALHERGLAGLEGYAAVMTGSHPEYMSVEIEDALRRFAAAGGSIAYLGGNGFAGKVAFKDDLMELRRSPLEAGRTWDGPIAEQSLAITNEPGGHLRASGRGEFSLTGVAISLMGFDQGRPFTRTPASREPAAAWLFEGVGQDTFGDSGIVLGAAAGYEVDATDAHLGTHPDTMVIARADGFPDSFVHDATRWYEGGEPELEGRRCAEMTLRHLASGGMIFSASSVAWLGALPASGMNDVGRITLNLLNRLGAHDGRNR
ncbi:N,N-dimethylformamidase beta subunit family domain-containing protein [Mesorhizobium sp. NPDC059054]|uniref:N,N-dimethylformamidase beta subunit family domain-containing protein n=1 Tax=Mesorhizobium sp. NPDC059054 TaxID=3346711 RepID=UPI0036C8F407